MYGLFEMVDMLDLLSDHALFAAEYEKTLLPFYTKNYFGMLLARNMVNYRQIAKLVNKRVSEFF